MIELFCVRTGEMPVLLFFIDIFILILYIYFVVFLNRSGLPPPRERRGVVFLFWTVIGCYPAPTSLSLRIPKPTQRYPTAKRMRKGMLTSD